MNATLITLAAMLIVWAIAAVECVIVAKVKIWYEKRQYVKKEIEEIGKLSDIAWEKYIARRIGEMSLAEEYLVLHKPPMTYDEIVKFNQHYRRS